MHILATQTASHDLFNGATVLSYTVVDETPMADIMLEIGSALNGMDASNAFILTVGFFVDGVSLKSEDVVLNVQQGRERLILYVDPIPVSVGKVITATLESSVSLDTAVDVTAIVRDIQAVQSVVRGRKIALEVNGEVDNTAPYSPSNINLTRKIGSTQPIYIAWPTTGATVTGTKSFNNSAAVPVAGDIVEMSPQPAWDIPSGQFWYELEFNSSDRPLTPSIVEYVFTDGSETQIITVVVVR